MTTEVASTRLPSSLLREIDREAAARGLSRSVYLAHLIERGAMRDSASTGAGDMEALRLALTQELRGLSESHRTLQSTLRNTLAASQTRASAPATDTVARTSTDSSLVERLVFSTLFTEALLKRVSASLYRNPGELAQVVREARDQATVEARSWQDRTHGAAALGKEDR